MAILLEERTVTLEHADMYRRVPIQRPSQPLARAAGWHASDLLRDIAIEYGWLKRGSAEDQEAQPTDFPWRWALGQAWEEYWFSFHCHYTADDDYTIWQPGERRVDEIAVNADALTRVPRDREGRSPRPDWSARRGITCWVEETKNTEKKVRSGEEFLMEKMWMHQARSYVLRYVPEARVGGGVCRWTVQYYRGDYRGSGPVCVQYAVYFSAGECVSTWDMLRDRKKLLEEKGVGPEQRVERAL